MSTHRLLLLRAALPLLGFLLVCTGARAVEVHGWAEPMPPADTIAGAVAGKLPRSLEVVTIQIRKHTELPNPKVKVWHLEVALDVRAKEALFDVDAGGGQQVTYLVRKTAAGESRPLTAQVVLVVAPEGKVTSTVKYQPDAQSTFGQPRSVFTSGNYVVRGSPEEAALPVTRTGAAASAAPAGNQTQSVIESRLRALVDANGVIHGEDPDLRPVRPFTLRDVRFEADGVMKATFTRVTSHAKVPVVGRIHFRQIVFELDDALRQEWDNPSRPPQFLLSADESALNSGGREVAIPLDPLENRAMGERHQRMVTPWESPTRAAAFIIAEGTLWDLDAKQRVLADWIPHFGSVREVKDAPGLFWKLPSEWGVALPVGGMTHWGMGTLRPRGKQYAPAFLQDGSGWVAADGVRVVTLEAGDFWRAEYDWSTGEYRNRHQVTTIGVFEGAKPLAWYGAHLFVERPGGGSKPVVRIDLGTGELLEMEKPYAFDGAGNYSAGRINGSPDGRYLARQHPEGIIFLYDLVREEEFRMDGTHVARLYGKDERVLDWPRMWANDRVFLGAYGWYNVATRERCLIADLKQTQGFESLSPMVTIVLPGGNFIDTVLVAVPIHPLPKVEERYRIDLRSGDMVRLPDFNEFSLASGMPAWIDEDRYLYVRDKGGLAEVGVWLYDVRSKSEKRLSALLPDSVADNDARAWSDTMNHRRAGSKFLLLPDRNQVVYVAKRGAKRDLLLVSLADGKAEVLESGTAGRQLARIDAEPIDLNIAGTWTGIWNHASHVELEGAATHKAGADTLTAEERFLGELQETDPERRERLTKIFRLYRPMITHVSQDFWDPVRVAREALLVLEQQTAAKRTALAAERDERKRAVQLVELQRLERGDYHTNDVTQLMMTPDFNRRTYDREKIHAAMYLAGANAWVSSPETPGTKEEFAQYYADRVTSKIMEVGRLTREVNVAVIYAEWVKQHRPGIPQP